MFLQLCVPLLPVRGTPTTSSKPSTTPSPPSTPSKCFRAWKRSIGTRWSVDFIHIYPASFPPLRYEFGSAIFIAWAGAFLTVVGGAMLAASCPRGKSAPRYPMSKPPSSKEYVWSRHWFRGWWNTSTSPTSLNLEDISQECFFFLLFCFGQDAPVFVTVIFYEMRY